MPRFENIDSLPPTSNCVEALAVVRVGRRKEDWPERLLACVDASRAKKFSWGRHDCALFAADCVRAMTGFDPAAAYRGGYADRRGAHAVLRRAGGLAAAWTAALGAPLDCPLHAQRGDVVLVDTDAGAATGVVPSAGPATGVAPSGGPATGVVTGGAIAAAGPEGLVFLPLHAALRAWRV